MNDRSGWNLSELHSEVDPQEKRKLVNWFERIKQNSTYFEDKSVDRTLFQNPRRTNPLSPINQAKEDGKTDKESPTLYGSETSPSSDNEVNSTIKLNTQTDKRSPCVKL